MVASSKTSPPAPAWSVVDLPRDPQGLLPIPGAIYTRIVGMDRQAIWLLGSGGADYLPEQNEDTLEWTTSRTRVIPIIARLFDQDDHDQFLRLPRNLIYIPRRQREPLRKGNYFVAYAVLEFFDRLARDDDFDQMRRARKEILLCSPLHKSYSLNNLGEPEAIEIDPESVAPPTGGWPPDTVVMGIIDYGLACANERFLDGDHEARTYAFWHMDPPDTLPIARPTVEPGFELLKRGPGGIDDLLTHAEVGGVLDEDLFYRHAGLIDPDGPIWHQAITRRASHGTHVMDLLAGYPPGDDRKDRPIVAVQLDLPTVQDTSGGMVHDRVKAGIDYIIERADSMSETNNPLPIVINCSFGYFADSHDGQSALERHIDQVVNDAGGRIRVVLPAGNGHLARCHAAVTSNPDDVTDLPWRVQPDDKTLSYVEIWLPEEDLPSDGSILPPQNRVAVSVIAPDGDASAPIEEDDALNQTASPVDPGSRARILSYDSVDSSRALVFCAMRVDSDRRKRRSCFYVVLQPTARLQPDSRRLAPSGLWTIRLHNHTLPADQEVHAWIQRDDTPYGYPIRGRQSYFDHVDYQRFSERTTPIGSVIEEGSHVEQSPDCPIKRAGMISAIATGKESIVIGGFVRDDLGLPPLKPGDPPVRQPRDLAAYSAGGPTTGPHPRPREDLSGPPLCLTDVPDGPDASGPSGRTRVLPGMLATGTRSNSTIALNGTSVAAPRVARQIADRVSSGNLLSREDVQAAACGDPFDPEKPERGGAGRIG